MNSYKLFVVLFLLVLSVGNEGAVVANKLVNTTYGTIRGTTLLSRNGREISAFLGIPYGQSTHGDLRFRVSKKILLMLIVIVITNHSN